LKQDKFWLSWISCLGPLIVEKNNVCYIHHYQSIIQKNPCNRSAEDQKILSEIGSAF